jgi:hypothetical protein
LEREVDERLSTVNASLWSPLRGRSIHEKDPWRDRGNHSGRLDLIATGFAVQALHRHRPL